MRVDFTLSSLSDNEWPILRRVPGLGSKPLLAAELGEARGLECHPLQRPGGALRASDIVRRSTGVPTPGGLATAVFTYRATH